MPDTPRNVLVTGGGGFLGRQIVGELKKLGDRVFAPRSSEFNLEDGQGVNEYFERCATTGTPIGFVVHSAAHYGGIGITMSEPFDIAVRNLRMAATIFEMAVNYEVKKIVSVGSACAYPGTIAADMYEADIFKGRCHPSVEAYGFSKRAQLVLMAAAKKQHNIDSVQLALTNLYGENDVYHEYRSHAIAALIKKVVEAWQAGGTVKAWGTGKPIRQFVWVRDAARIVARALDWPHDEEPVNVDGTALSIADLTLMIADIVDLPHERIKWDASHPDGVGRKVLNGDKLRRLFPDYVPAPFNDSLTRAVRWYIDNQAEADLRR